MSLRARVATASLVGALCAIAVIAAGAWWSVRDATYDEAATSVRTLAQTLAREEMFQGERAMRECRAMVGAIPTDATADAGPLQQTLWLVDRSGRSCSMDGSPVPRAAVELARPVAVAQGDGAATTVHVDGVHMTARVERLGDGVALVAGRSVDEADRVLRRLAWMIAAFAAMAALVAAAAGLVVVRMLAHPMRRIARGVELVTASGDVSIRLDDDQLDEVRPLVARINDLLASVHSDDVLRRERAADASHDARSPLTSLRASMELLSLDEVSSASPAQAREIVSDAIAEVDELHDAIRDLERCIVDADPPAVDTVEVGSLLHALVRRARRRYPTRSVELDVVGPTTTIDGDRRELERALWNVIHNALHHGGADARVLVSGAGAIVRIADDGVGIPDDELDVVLRRNARGSRSDAAGSGLGLAVATRVVDQHGGTIRLEQAERGTVVTIDLSPRDRARRGRAAASAHRPSPA